MSYNNQLPFWIDSGLKDNYNYLVIVRDLEDKDYFPRYFNFYSDYERYLENIISESKMKVVELIRLSYHKKI